jgi:hypothetical protein
LRTKKNQTPQLDPAFLIDRLG